MDAYIKVNKIALEKLAALARDGIQEGDGDRVARVEAVINKLYARSEISHSADEARRWLEDGGARMEGYADIGDEGETRLMRRIFVPAPKGRRVEARLEISVSGDAPGALDLDLYASSQEAIEAFSPIEDPDCPGEDYDCEDCPLYGDDEKVCQVYDLLAQYDFEASAASMPELSAFDGGLFEIENDVIHMRAWIPVRRGSLEIDARERAGAA